MASTVDWLSLELDYLTCYIKGSLYMEPCNAFCCPLDAGHLTSTDKTVLLAETHNHAACRSQMCADTHRLFSISTMTASNQSCSQANAALCETRTFLSRPFTGRVVRDEKNPFSSLLWNVSVVTQTHKEINWLISPTQRLQSFCLLLLFEQDKAFFLLWILIVTFRMKSIGGAMHSLCMFSKTPMSQC